MLTGIQHETEIDSDDVEYSRKANALLRQFNTLYGKQMEPACHLHPGLKMDNETRFLEAVLAYDMRTILSLRPKVNINCTNIWGETALMLLAARPRTEVRNVIMNFLIDCGADPYIVSPLGATMTSIESLHGELEKTRRSLKFSA